MIFGRKRKPVDDPVDTEEEALEIVGDDAGEHDSDVDESDVEGSWGDTDADADIDEDALAEAELEAAQDGADAEFDDDADDDVDEVDWRADGPFDSEEVDLGEEVTRVDLGSLVITPWAGLGLQLQVNEASRAVQAVTAVWKNSGLEVALFAAPASGGLADELREDAVDEAEQGGLRDRGRRPVRGGGAPRPATGGPGRGTAVPRVPDLVRGGPPLAVAWHAPGRGRDRGRECTDGGAVRGVLP